MNKNKSRATLSDDKLTVEYEKEEFVTSLPNLASEMLESNKKATVPISGIRQNPQKPKDPTAIDFIRRCSTNEQAIEIIDYLENNGEISYDQALEFRTRLESEGLLSFGKHKSRGFYEREYRR
ncbi:hypothetical protein NEF87_002735 [Candidatus Lokiarchaeum ossiferum]|uniref:DUF2095 domain-containing protein n=1 Tax=Candidatus Lokiarchaeum ossiferum TaxID=2951803 RepID=A0ABY6HSG1_9ARCH|nr:hypothetical protein NEF87_002735 [Candidatus Lokiarchaeum sp. B-35]